MAIHQENIFNGTPAQVFKTLTDGDEFAKMTGAPADIDAQAGGEFSCFGGKISGRFIEINDETQIVQAWRVDGWEPGVYSVARFSFVTDGSNTRVTLEQDGHPREAESHLEEGWPKMYWEPLAAYLQKS